MLPKIKTVKDPRELIRSPKLNLIAYPYDLPYPYGLENGATITKEYIHRLAEKTANITQTSYAPNVYTNVHDNDIIHKCDLDNEEERILWVYECYRNKTNDLDFALYYCGKTILKTAEAKHDSFSLDPKIFYKKYRYYTEKDVEKLKKTHINIIEYYPNARTKFYLHTVWKQLYNVFGNDNGQLSGIRPFINGSTLAHDVRYLCHIDNPEKFQYDPNDIICINCNDAKDIILSGAPIDEKADMNEAIIRLARESGIETTTDLLMYIKTVDANIYHYANTPQGFKMVNYAAKDNYFIRNNRQQKAKEDRRDYLMEQMTNALRTIANKK